MLGWASPQKQPLPSTRFRTPDGYTLWGHSGGPQMFVRLWRTDFPRNIYPAWYVSVKTVFGRKVAGVAFRIEPGERAWHEGLTFYAPTQSQALDLLLSYLEQTGNINLGMECQY